MTKKQASDKQEKLVAKTLGWKQVKGSGARPNHPGDVIGAEWLGECKTHVDADHKVHFAKDIWDKIAEEADSRFKSPAYFSDDGSQTEDKTWVIFRERYLQDGIDVKPYPEDLKSSINFYAYELKQAYNTIDDIVFVFTFDTVKDDFMSQRHKLYLTKLTTFSEIIV